MGLAFLAGCNKAAPTPAPPSPPPTAEERFARIVQTLVERLEQSDLAAKGATADYGAPAGTPVTEATVRVEHELTPPSADSEPYRATICLSTPDSKVTIVLPTPTEEERESAAAKDKAKVEQLSEELEGVPDLDSLVVPSTDGLSGKLGSSPIHEIDPGDSKSCFELEFKDGRWELLTKLDRENEPFYTLAIEYAMRKQ